jgi:hypothetical protein
MTPAARGRCVDREVVGWEMPVVFAIHACEDALSPTTRNASSVSHANVAGSGAGPSGGCP